MSIDKKIVLFCREKKWVKLIKLHHDKAIIYDFLFFCHEIVFNWS